jgi:N-acetylmuramoyl-L-alanine amidase
MNNNLYLKLTLAFLVLIINYSLLIAQNKLDVIVLDAGHGGKDPGTISDFSGIQEKNIVLPITIKLGKLIEDKFPDIKVIYTRVIDDYPELKERTKLANDNKAKLFISIHANHKKMEETQKHGFEIYLLNRGRMPEAIQYTMKANTQLVFQQLGADTLDNFIFASLAQSGFIRYNEYLANIIEVNMLGLTELESRGVFQAGNWVTLAPSMPTVLVETGYLSDKNDEIYLSGDKGQNDIAIALFKAFQNYKMLYEMQ